MKGYPRISSVYNAGPSDAPRGAEADRRNLEAARDLWRRHGYAVLDPEDVRDEWLRRGIINEAEARFGRRGMR